MLDHFLSTSIQVVQRCSNFGDAMRAARFLGELCWKNSVGCYQLIDLENDLADRFAHLFKADAAKYQTESSVKEKTPYLHVLSKAYDTGGHTKVVERFIASQALKQSAVVVTEKAQENTRKRLATAALGLEVFPAKLDAQDKVARLLKKFAETETVVLHIHPNDIESTLAANLAKRWFGTQILFYNHADHVFSYGYACADHSLELSYFGWTLSERRGTKNIAHFVGIPLHLPEQAAASPSGTEKYFASSGSAYKFKPSQGFSFPQAAAELCQRSGLSMVLVGPNPRRDWWWWRLRRKMGSQLRFTGKLQYQDYLNCIRQATAYIDSFPMTGGTSFSEILAQGVPCFGILTGAHGYSPADQLKSPSQTMMIEDVLRFLDTPQTVQDKIADLQDQVRQAHALETVAERIVHIKHHPAERQSPPWHNPVPVDTHFYEKIWQAQTLFSPPVHSRPNWKIGFAFVRLWWNKAALNKKQ